MIINAIPFAPAAGVPGATGVDARPYAVVAARPVPCPTPMTWGELPGTGVPTARRRAFATEPALTFSGVLRAQHLAGLAPTTDQPTNDATPLGIHSPGRPTS
jgi:hypothetical protein